MSPLTTLRRITTGPAAIRRPTGGHATFAVATALLMLSGGALAQRPHQHGVADLSLVIEAGSVTAQLDAPLDSLVGFERAPRTDAERQRARAALARLADPAGLLRLPASAGCSVTASQVQAPVLEGGEAAGGHADAQATWTWRCRDAAALRALPHGLFEAFAPLHRLQAQVVTPQGQHRVTLRRPQAELRWGR